VRCEARIAEPAISARSIAHRDLARLAAQQVDARIEWCVRSSGGLGRQRAGDQRGLEQRFRREQPGQRVGGGELRAVEQRQALLGAERRGQPGFRQRGGGAHPFAPKKASPTPIIAAAMCDKGRDRPMRRPSLAPARPESHRAPAWLRAAPPSPGRSPSALRQAAQLQRHHQAHDRDGRRFAGAGGMAQHDIALQRGEVAVSMRTLASFPKPVLMP
jgi:hypothetical protein